LRAEAEAFPRAVIASASGASTQPAERQGAEPADA
jgi:hypothetical protein